MVRIRGGGDTQASTEVTIVELDERGSSWEYDRPHFRVYIHGGPTPETSGWTCTYDITGADVLQVID